MIWLTTIFSCVWTILELTTIREKKQSNRVQFKLCTMMHAIHNNCDADDRSNESRFDIA